MGTERLVLQTSTEQIFSAAPSGLGLFLKSIFPGLHPLRGFHPGLSSAAPLGLLFSEKLCASHEASPNGAKDHSQGIHPLVNEAKNPFKPQGGGRKTRSAYRSFFKNGD